MSIEKETVIKVLRAYQEVKSSVSETEKANGKDSKHVCDILGEQKMSIEVPPTVIVDGEPYTIDVKAAYVGAADGESERYIVFIIEEHPEKTWRLLGVWDSWSESSWEDIESVHEVLARPVITMTYEPV